MPTIVDIERAAADDIVVRGASLASLIAGCSVDLDPVGPRRIRHRFGVTDVPARPRRVVSVGYEEHDLILHFGVVPVLQRDYFGDQPCAVWPWSQSLLGGQRPQTFTERLPIARIRALQPDLIMATNAGLDRREYRRLSRIAPTVAHNADYPEWETPRDVMLMDVGRVFGREGDAQRMIDVIRTRVMEVCEAHPHWRGMEAVSVGFALDDGLFVDLRGHARGELLVELGFRIPELPLATHIEGERFANVDLADVRQIDRDLVVWIDGDDDPTPILELPGRDRLRAHREGREIYLGTVHTAAYTVQSPRALAYLLDELPPLIEAAIDGDPATVVPTSARAGVAPRGA